MRSLDIAGTGMQAQQTNVEVISNNIANMTTTGYKRRRAEFQDLIYQNLRRVGSNSSDTGQVVPSGAQVGLGVKTAAIYRIGEQGNLQQTSNSLDLAVRGNGYFQVTLPSGETAYTRDGTFSLSPEGQIVSADGYVVQPGVTIPSNATSVTINTAGQVQVTLDGHDAADGRADAACGVSERRRPGRAGRQSVPAKCGQRQSGDGHSGLARFWFGAARVCRDLERERGDGDHRPDHGAAGV
jgi:flagellar hook-basal body protein